MPTATATKTVRRLQIPEKISYLKIIFSLPLRHRQIREFRNAFVAGIEGGYEQRLVSHETKTSSGKIKYDDRYPVVQFRCEKGQLAIFAFNEGVPVVEKFLQQYCPRNETKAIPFRWNGRIFRLRVLNREKENQASVNLCRAGTQLYRLHSWLPFSDKNYAWWKENRNLPDVKKTEKLQTLLISHICVFIHACGGYIPRKKIKLTILDKDRLKKISYKDEGQVAYDIRFSVNLQLPPFFGLGNHVAFGFGWMRPEY